MKNNIAWATPLVSALLLAEKELDRHWHPRHETIEKDVTIMNRFGLHVRPAAMLVRLANRFDSTTSVANEGVEVDGKSVMALIADGHGTNNCWFQLKWVRISLRP